MKDSTRCTKLSLWILVLAVAFAMAACGGDDRRNGPSNNTENGQTGADAGNGDDVSTGEDTMPTDDTSPQPDTGDPGTCTPLSPPIQGDQCDPLCQTGCADGQNCVAGLLTNPEDPNADPVVASQCQPAGAASAGDSCGPETACQVGHICTAFAVGEATTCFEYCRPGAGDCAAGYNCINYTGGQETRVGICVMPEAECTFYPDDSCGEGENCYQTSLGERCLPYNDQAADGSACTSPTDCNDAQVCMGGVCRAMCEDNDDCTGVDCTPLAVEDEDGEVIELPFGACLPD